MGASHGDNLRRARKIVATLPWTWQIEDLVIFDDGEVVTSKSKGGIAGFDAVPMLVCEGQYLMGDLNF